MRRVAWILMVLTVGGSAAAAQQADTTATESTRRFQFRSQRMAEMAARMQARQTMAGPRWQERMMRRAPGMQGARRGGPGMGPGVEQLLEQREGLELGDEQVAQLEGIEAELHAERERLEPQIEDHRDQLRAEWEKDLPDPQAVRQHANALAEAEQSLRVTHMEAAARARGILTEGQRGQVRGWAQAGRAQMMRSMRSRRGGCGFRAPMRRAPRGFQRP